MSDTRDLILYDKRSTETVGHFPGWILPFSMMLGSVLGCSCVRIFPGFFEGISYGDVFSGINFSHSLPLLFLVSAWPCFLILLFSTSALGCWMIPLIYFSRGFSVSFSFVLLLMYGLLPTSVIELLSLPAFFSIFALFLLGEKACQDSYAVRNALNCGSSVTVGRILFAVFLLVLSALMRKSYIPLDFI